MQDLVATTPTECQAPRCLLPGIPIQTGLPRTPASLDVGHIIPTITDPRQTWTLNDVRPEHARCNRSAGLAIGKARRAARISQQNKKQNTLTINKNDW